MVSSQLAGMIILKVDDWHARNELLLRLNCLGSARFGINNVRYTKMIGVQLAQVEIEQLLRKVLCS